MGNRRYSRIACVISCGLVATSAAQADQPTGLGAALTSAISIMQEGLDLVWQDVGSDDLRLKVGVAVGSMPDYQGSDDYRLKVIPIIDIKYKDRLRLNYNKLTLAAYKEGAFEAGPLVKYKAGRTESRNPVLAGLGNVKATAEIGGYMRYKTKVMQLTAEYRHALGSGYGDNIKLTAGHALMKSGDFVLAAAVSTQWLSKQASQTRFGITDAQSATSVAGLAAYDGKAGFSRIDVHLLGLYDLTDRAKLLGMVQYGRLLGNAAHSPLVADGNGSPNQWKMGLSLTFEY